MSSEASSVAVGFFCFAPSAARHQAQSHNKQSTDSKLFKTKKQQQKQPQPPRQPVRTFPMCIAKFRLVGMHRCTFTRADRNLTLVFFFSKKLLFSFPFFLYLLFGCQIPPDSGTQVPGQFLEQSFQAPWPTLVQDSLVHFSCFFFL